MVNTKPDGAEGQTVVGRNVVVPHEFRLATSDTIRCLRTALDYLVATLARSVGLPDNYIIFPFNEERKKLEDSLTKEAKGIRTGPMSELVGKLPDLHKIIMEEIRPYKSDDGTNRLGDMLWRLNKTDNIDKHRLITPTVQATHFEDVTFESPGFPSITLKNVKMTGFGPRNSLLAFGQGAEAKLKENGRYTVAVVFPDESYFAGMPMIDTLVELSNLVSQVIDTFETYFEGG